jgi:hypothetical protein
MARTLAELPAGSRITDYISLGGKSGISQARSRLGVEPVDLVQINVRRQRAERAPLRDTDLSANLDDLFHEVHDLWVLNPLGDLGVELNLENQDGEYVEG